MPARHASSERFGGLLIFAGFAWFLATLSESDDEWIYSVGRVSGWAVEVVLIYVILAFPTGRLPGRVDRALVGAAGLVVLFLYLPTALLIDSYPVPTAWADCGDGCPGNAFMVVATEPAFIEDVVRPLREILTVALFAAVTARIVWRMRRASSLMKRALDPVLAVSIFRLAAFAVVLAGRRAAPDSQLVEVGTWLLAITVPLLALAFLAGVWMWRLFMAAAMQRLATRLRTHPGPEDLRDALADAFDDSSLDIVYWLENGTGRWVSVDGREVSAPVATPERGVTEVNEGERPVAAILHDPALQDDSAFTETAAAYALMTLDNHRLSAQTASLVREVRESRARIQSSADDERRRIEHDLHDGAQQRLVALRIKLELAAERADETRGQQRRACCVRSAAMWRTRSTRSARSRAGSTRRRSPTGGSSRRSARRRCGRPCRRPCSPPASAATRGTSRAPPTSAASKRCRTRPSTRPTPRPWSSSSRTTATCASRYATTAGASTRRRSPAGWA